MGRAAMEVAAKQDPTAFVALPRNWLRSGRQDLSQNASRRLRLEGALNAQLTSLRRWKWPPLRT
jgi:hypothetical protein